MFIIESRFIMWSLLITVFCAIVALYIWSNKQLKRKLKKKYNAESIREILTGQRLSIITFFSIIAVLLLIIAGYDLRLRKLDKQLEELEEVISINETIEEEQKSAEKTSFDKVVNEENYYPPITENPADETAPVELKSQNTIQDIFGDDQSQKSISDIKTRYEELLATYLLMEKCEKASQNDYVIIMTSLQKEINAIQAPVRLQNDTLTAAKGSYEELYSSTDCSKPSLKDTEKQYNAYIQSLSRSLQK
jgi:hypothetical protein